MGVDVVYAASIQGVSVRVSMLCTLPLFKVCL